MCNEAAQSKVVRRLADRRYSRTVSRGEASCRQRGGNCWSDAIVVTAVGHFDRSLRYEYLYQREIEQAAELAEEVEAFRALYNEIRPHESLGQRIPLSINRGDHHLFRALSLQDP